MKKSFTPKNKLSKKAQKELNAQKRVLWGSLKPVTRVAPGKKDLETKRRNDRDFDADEDN